MWHPNKEVIEGILKLFKTMVNFHSVQTSPFPMKGFEKIGKYLQKLSSNYFANMAISAKAVILDILRKNLIHASWNYDVAKSIYEGALANTCGVKGINSDGLRRPLFKLDGSNIHVGFKPDRNRVAPSGWPFRNPGIAGPGRIFQTAGLKIKSGGSLYD